MTFSEEIRQAAQQYWDSSFSHPFVTGIGDGTLPLAKFRHYVLQDAYYLKHFAKIQARAASKAQDFATIAELAEHATSTYAAELSLHQSFFEPLGISSETLAEFEPAPTAYAYVSHMHHASEGTLGETIAAILPCYWLYYEVGQQLQGCTPDSPIYAQWIATYSSEWFERVVFEQVDRLNDLAERASAEERERMKQHFVKSCYYELMFWQMGWTEETFEQIYLRTVDRQDVK
ncbi:thiaminase II [Exiguobacterium undae]|uniref:thiaminase II n=1 Tax=Exiguobacterium undae TaxID=169177 RepID=UPI00384A595C